MISIRIFDSMQQRSFETSSFSSFGLARRQSFGFFQDVTESQWNQLRVISSSREMHWIPGDHTTYARGQQPMKADGSSKVKTEWYQSHYEPDFSCQFRKRVGGNGLGDGPKWVCDPHRLIAVSKARKKANPSQPGCLIYSVGSCGDFSFETALQMTLGRDICEIHIFDMDDYSNKMPPNLNLHYHQWGLSKTSSVEEKKGHVYKTMSETLKELGHDGAPAIDIFKIDCEGCEHETFTDWLDDSNPILQQILVEVHAATANQMKDFFDVFRAAGYVKFSSFPRNTMCNFQICHFMSIPF